MASSVYISSKLTSSHLEFMKILDEVGIDVFRFEEIENQMGVKFSNLNEVMENLVHKGLLSRIERGKFCKANFRDKFVIGTFVVNQGTIAYLSALQLHGLIKSSSNKIFVQTYHRKRDKDIFGVTYKFVQISSSKYLGISKFQNRNTSFDVTDLEKTIVDCFDLPQHSGEYKILIRAFDFANFSPERLILYCKAVNNHAATKRIGYLAELFKKRELEPFIHFARDQVTQTYNPLNPLGIPTGKFNSDWKIRLNISEEELLANKHETIVNQ